MDLIIRILLTACGLSVGTTLAFAADVDTRPQASVLVLRSGGTMRGVVARVADRYVVQFDAVNEARVPVQEVVYVCVDLEEAYQRKLADSEDSIEARLSLARWCLENGLLARTADQLLAIESQHGSQSQSEWLHQRLLQLAYAGELAETREPAELRKPQVLDVEATLRNLPEDAVVDFTRTVQPLLLNRCANSGCHGPQGKSPYLLLRPPANNAISRRLTERNIAASLIYVDRAAPQHSRLLEVARTAHGGRATPPVSNEEQPSFEALERWVLSIAEPSGLAKPRGIGEPNELLFQSASTVSRLSPTIVTEAEATLPPSSPSSEIAPTAPVDADYRPRDPFDPEVFNRRYHRNQRDGKAIDLMRE